MTYGEKERTKSPGAVLKEAGFDISVKCCSRPSCFDYAAKKNDNVLFLKFQLDLDNFSLCESLELKIISECIPAALLIIAEKTREKPLEDDTVYSRYDILSITPKTFENILIHKSYPLIQALPGGYYVDIDSEALRLKRQKLGLSVGEIADMIGVSRRTLYGYERGMTRASVTVAYNLIRTLGVPIAKPVDIFEKSRHQSKCLLVKAKLAITKNKLLQKILRKLARYHMTTVKKAPFDFIINVPEENVRIIGGIANKKELALERRVEEIVSVCRIIKAHPILVTNGRKPINKDISCIDSDEFSKIEVPEDLISKV